jgi:hypothetical protein
MSKQDRQGVRTPADIERKYNLGRLGQPFSETLGIATDARDSVLRVESELRNELEQQITSLTRDTERIIMAALASYVEEDDLESLRQTVRGELSVMAENITMNFTKTTERLDSVNGELQTVIDELQKHFVFGVDGLTIKAGENAMELLLDNDLIKFMKNGEQFGWWDGVNFHTGNVVVNLNERMQIGNFAFVPRSHGSLDFLKVGG